MSDLDQRDVELRVEAEQRVLPGLLRVASRYGAPHLSGSYVLNLMVWRDLDLYLEANDLNLASFFVLGGELADTLAPVRMRFRNERLAQTPGLPHGLYWGIYLGEARRAWKIDLWLVDSSQYHVLQSTIETIAVRLTPSARRIILEIKTAIWNDPRYRREVTSRDVYAAVLDQGVTTLEEFWAYIRQKRAA
ncbi:MAG TPA: hypothetical protein VGD69_20200 [Herpetosiphonaceae bacterium]